MYDHVMTTLLMPLNSEVSNGDVHVLDYNVNWMYSTFTSRAVAEALLSPERESGNLTSRDYDAAIQFLPGNHRHYQVRFFHSLWLYLRSHLARAIDSWDCCWLCHRLRAPSPIPPYERPEAVVSLIRHNFSRSLHWCRAENGCTSRLPA